MIDLEQLSSALDSGTTSSKPDFSDVVVNTKESTDESGIEEMLTNDLGQPGRVASYPCYENFVEVDNPATDGGPEKKRIDAIDGPISLQVRETIPRMPTKSVFQVEAGEPADQTAMQTHTRLTWDDGLEQLKAFKVKFGHVDVIMTNTDQKNQPLLNFVKSIRESYKNILEGQTSGNKHLSDQRIAELERMGFKFQMLVRTSWEHRFEDLRQHFRTHGNSEVPKDTTLGRWVKTQRHYFKTQTYYFRTTPEGEKSSLGLKRIGLLDSIGFDWRVDTNDKVTDHVSANADQGR